MKKEQVDLLVAGGMVITMDAERRVFEDGAAAVGMQRASANSAGVEGQPDIYDQMIVLADVQIKNQTDIPLFLHDMWGVVHLPDEDQRSLAASGRDFEKVFIAYPDLKQFEKAPLPRDLTLTPGQEVQGMVIYNFPISKEQWASRTGMDLTFSFLHQKPLILEVAPNLVSEVPQK